MVSLLPPNATLLERAIDTAAPRSLLDTLAGAPASLKSAPHDEIVPWLAAEWFLADFIGYFPDARTLIAAGLPWLKVRGTAAAVKQALIWIGMSATLEEDGARLQIDPGTAAAPTRLADIKHLVGASIPAHVQLYRMYHGYDMRRIGLSGPAALDDGLLSDDSGIWIDGVKLSFGARHGADIDATQHIAGLTLTQHAHARAYYEDRPRLSAFALDSERVINYGIVAGQLITDCNIDPAADPVTLSARRTISRAALVLSDDDEAMGNENARFAGCMRIERAPFTLCGSRLSDHDNQAEDIPIDEMFIAETGSAIDAAPAGTVYPHGGAILHSLAAIHPPYYDEPRAEERVLIDDATLYDFTPATRYGWQGRWDGRIWRGNLSFNLTTENI